jgi:hypothetical protein
VLVLREQEGAAYRQGDEMTEGVVSPLTFPGLAINLEEIVD